MIGLEELSIPDPLKLCLDKPPKKHFFISVTSGAGDGSVLEPFLNYFNTDESKFLITQLQTLNSHLTSFTV